MPVKNIGRKRLISQVYSLQDALYPRDPAEESVSEESSSSSSEDDVMIGQLHENNKKIHQILQETNNILFDNSETFYVKKRLKKRLHKQMTKKARGSMYI